MTNPSDPNDPRDLASNSSSSGVPGLPPESPTDSEALSEPPLQPNSRRLWLTRVGLGLGTFLVLGVMGGTWYGWVFIHKRLAPLIEQNLSSLINRPVKLGEVQGFSLNGIRFGASSLPATAEEPDQATVTAVDVKYNLLPVLWTKELGLEVTLINPQAYIEQDEDGRWVNLELEEREAGAIEIKLQRVQATNASAVLVPYVPQPPTSKKPTPAPANRAVFSNINATVSLLDDNQRISFDLTGQQTENSRFNINGEWFSPISQLNLQLNGENLSLAPLSRLLKGLPLDIQTGQASGNLLARIRPNQPIALTGTARITDVAARYQPQPGLKLPSTIPLQVTKTQGRLRFQGQLITIEDLSTLYANKIPVQLAGMIQPEKGVELKALVNPVAIATLAQTFQVKLPGETSGEVKAEAVIRGPIDKIAAIANITTTKPTVFDKIEFSQIRTQVAYVNNALLIEGFQAKPTLGGEIQGVGQAKLGTQPGAVFDFLAKDLPVRELAQRYEVNTENLTLDRVSLRGQVFGPLNDLQAIVQSNLGGGIVKAGGKIVNGNLVAEVRAEKVQLGTLVSQIPSLLQAPVTGTVQLVSPLNNFSLNAVQAVAQGGLELAGGNVRAAARLEKGQWQGVVDTQNVQLGQIAPNLPSQLQVPFTGQIQLAGNLCEGTVCQIPTNLQELNASGQGRIAVAGGVVGVAAQLTNGTWQADVQARQVQIGQLAPQIPAALQAPFSGNFRLAGTVESFDPKTIQARGDGALSVGNGLVAITDSRLNQGQWQATIQAQQVPLGQLAPQLPAALQAPVSGRFELAGNLESFDLNTLEATGQGGLAIAGGLLSITEGRLNEGKWQAAVEARGIQLQALGLPNSFDNTLAGGRFNLSGSLEALNLQNIQANGQVVASRLPILQQGPAGATFAWNGERLQILDAQGQGLRAAGTVTPNFQNLASSEINLNVQLADANLGAIPSLLPNLPDTVQLVGRADFAGRVAGTVANPAVDGQLQLRELAVNQVKFDPVLQGGVQVSAAGGRVQLAGQEDRISAILGPNFRPEQFEVKFDEAIATGQLNGDNLSANVSNFPLALLNLRAPEQLPGRGGLITGQVSGDLTANLNQRQATGNLTITNPSLGAIRGDRLTADFAYANNVGTLNTGTLKIGESLYKLAGKVDLAGNNPSFQGNVTIAQGNIQDILKAAEWFDFTDIGKLPGTAVYGNASDVQTVAVGLPNSTLLNQLRRFSEISQLATQAQEARESDPVPSLADLEGTFGGQINFSGSLNQGLTANFDLSGQNWQWGTYDFNQVIAKGNFENGVLSLVPVRLESDDTLIAFNGQVGENQSGQLRVENLPVSLIERFRPLPFDVTGDINATATLLGGSLQNPQAIGEVSLVKGTLNQTQVQSARGSFSLSNGRLNFGSQILVQGTEPISIDGSIPSPLPVGSVSSLDEQISLDINVQNEGLSLLNVFSRQQVKWVSGEGSVNVKVAGTLEAPIATGTARLENATFASNLLPDPLTNVNGTVRFQQDRIFVDNLTGEFSRGQVTANGTIPLATTTFARSQPIENPLTINLDRLTLNVKALYQGDANGQVVITGSALSPEIGGNIRLTNGQVLLAERSQTASTPQQGAESTNSGIVSFNNLQLALGDRVTIASPPLLQFLADGQLTVNGSLDDIRPSGTIQLKRGSVNLLATQFRLDRSHPNTAQFNPSTGLDPLLNVRLVTSVSEVQNYRQPSTEGSAETPVIPSATFGNVQTVRIFANVNGLASELADNLELTSSPGRTESEIVALLGGSFVNTLGRGDSTLALANLAGSALLSNIQNLIGDALGLSEFRLFTTTGSGTNPNNQSLNVGAEASVDITGNFSASALKILTTNQPALFSIRYRLNDQTLLRGATNFDNDNRIQVEYETRF